MLCGKLHYYYRPLSLGRANSGSTWLSTNAKCFVVWSFDDLYFYEGEQDVMAIMHKGLRKRCNRLNCMARQKK